GRRVVTASDDGTARLWDAADGRPLATLRHRGPIVQAVFDAAGELVATASADGTARVWDAATGHLIASLVGHSAPVRAVEFAPGGWRLVTASWDGTARVWDLAPLEGKAPALARWTAAFTGSVLDEEGLARGLGRSAWGDLVEQLDPSGPKLPEPLAGP